MRVGRGFSMIEVVLSALVVGLVVIGSMQAVGMVGTLRRDTADRTLANVLAEDMIAELGLTGFGSGIADLTVAGVPGALDRSGFTKLDDYHWWSSTPAEDRSGVAIAGAERLGRTVAVSWVRAGNGSASALPTGVKQMTVWVTRGDQILVERKIIRSEAGALAFEDAWGGVGATVKPTGVVVALDPTRQVELNGMIK